MPSGQRDTAECYLCCVSLKEFVNDKSGVFEFLEVSAADTTLISFFALWALWNILYVEAFSYTRGELIGHDAVVFNTSKSRVTPEVNRGVVAVSSFVLYFNTIVRCS